MQFEDSYVQLFPVDKTKCDVVDPVRDVQYRLYTRQDDFNFKPSCFCTLFITSLKRNCDLFYHIQIQMNCRKYNCALIDYYY